MKKLVITLVVTMLATHLPAPPIAILTVSTLGDGSLRIIGSGSGYGFGVAYHWVLQSTTDFSNWTPISTNTFIDHITVTNIVFPTNTATFFRVKSI